MIVKHHKEILLLYRHMARQSQTKRYRVGMFKVGTSRSELLGLTVIILEDTLELESRLSRSDNLADKSLTRLLAAF